MNPAIVQNRRRELDKRCVKCTELRLLESARVMAATNVHIQDQFEALIKKLENVASRPKTPESDSDFIIFIDDIVLKLRLWAADIGYDQGSLKWAGEITSIRVTVRERLQDIDQKLDALVEHNSLGEKVPILR